MLAGCKRGLTRLVAVRVAATAVVSAALAVAQPASQPVGASAPASAPQPRETVPAGEARALSWIKQFTEAPVARYGGEVTVFARSYAAPRPIRLWWFRLPLDAVGFVVTPPADFAGAGEKFETRCATTLDFARQTGVQLAINTSAFGPFRSRMGAPMEVVGLAAEAGRVYSQPQKDYAALLIGRDSRVRFASPPADETDVWIAIPGFRMLLAGGAIAVTEHDHNTSFGGLNPRTAVGVDAEEKHLIVAVVDGRQPGASMGMTLVELACLMRMLGCADALNLDGGGSSTLVAEDAGGGHAVLNCPVGQKAPGSLRQVANNLGFALAGEAPPPTADAREPLRDFIIEAVGRADAAALAGLAAWLAAGPQRVAASLPGVSRRIDDWSLLRRGDLIWFRSTAGKGLAGVFWARRTIDGQEWVWCLADDAPAAIPDAARPRLAAPAGVGAWPMSAIERSSLRAVTFTQSIAGCSTSPAEARR